MKTYCKFGHPRTPENLYANGGCRTCGNLRGAQRYQAKRAANPSILTRAERYAIRSANRKTHCDAGHPLDPAKHGCKICEKEARARARELAPPKPPKPPQAYCAKGHPKGYFGPCKVCKKEAKKRYFKAHPEIRAAIKKRYLERHPEAREKAKAKSRAWAKAHPEKVKAYSKAHPRGPKTPEQSARQFARRRARKRGNGGSYTRQEERTLRDFYENRCVCCWRTEEELTTAGLLIVLDHVVPISKGGTSFIGNLQPLCHHEVKGVAGCNEAKGDFHDTDYRIEGLIGLS